MTLELKLHYIRFTTPLLSRNSGLFKQLICIGVLLSLNFISLAGNFNGDMKFRRYGNEQGLNQAGAICILQDNDGFMWIGTPDGLNRFDGYNFTTFRNTPDDTTSLSNNYVRCIIQDHDNRIWLGTRGGGLNLYDPSTKTFSAFLHDPANPESISDNNVRSIYQDRQKRIWVGTQFGLNLLDPAKKTFTRILNDPQDKQSISGNMIWCIYQDSKDRVWVGTDGEGLNLLNTDDYSFSKYTCDPKNGNSLSNNSVRSLLEDKRGRLWVGTDNGLNMLDENSRSFRIYRHIPGRANTLSNNVVRTIFEDERNLLWIGTDNGLNIYNPEKDQFKVLKYDPANPASISNDRIFSITQDAQRNIWIGTYGNGINLWDPTVQAFAHYKLDLKENTSLSNNSVWGMCKDSKNQIWIGTQGGLNLFDPDSESFTHYQHDPRDSRSLSHNSVTGLCFDNQERFWVGTNWGGLNLMDTKTGKFRRFQHDPKAKNSIGTNRIQCIYQDRQDRVWIGTRDIGLNLLDTETWTFENFRNQLNNPYSISNNRVSCVFQDDEDRIWIGTSGGGLNSYNPKTKRFYHYMNDPDNPASISNNYVTRIFQDSKGRLWIGTYTGGLNLFDPSTASFKSWREKDGLSNDAIYGILEDDHGNLWLSTNKGISMFDPDTEKFKSFDKHDGLQDDEFNLLSFLKDDHGYMYFGGVNGFNVFHPDSLYENTYLPPVVITNFLLFNKTVSVSDSTTLNKAPESIEQIALAHDDYIFAFEFSALNYRQAEKNKYAYKLEGFNENWIYTDYKDRKATYTNVPPGTYTFRVKASNDDGYWNETGASVKVIIKPPWWLTWWAKITWIVLFITILYAAYKLRVATLNKQKKKLEETVESRTAEVVHQKNEIESQAEELKVINQKLVNLGEFKEALTGMIVHDFKNSLNGIISSTEGEPNARKLKSIKNASRHVLNMALNMLDVQKFEQAEIMLDKACHEVADIIAESLDQVSFLMEQKSLELTTDLQKELCVTCDNELIIRVVTNLLINAIKFTPANGSVHIESKSLDGFVMFSISDSGQGIAQNKLQAIFDKFVQIDRKNSGEVRSTGLGLTFCKMVIEAHDGEIGAESEVGLGSKFWFTLKDEKAEDTRCEDIDLDSIAATVIELDENDKSVLRPFKTKLNQVEVYDYSDVKEILSSIDAQGLPSVMAWIGEMQNALYNSNEEKYDKLVNDI